MFWQYPFASRQATIEAELHMPDRAYSSAFYSLVHALLHPDPAARATMWQVQTHPWAEQHCDIGNYTFARVLHNNAADYELHPPVFLSELNELLAAHEQQQSVERQRSASGSSTDSEGAQVVSMTSEGCVQVQLASNMNQRKRHHHHHHHHHGRVDDQGAAA